MNRESIEAVSVGVAPHRTLFSGIGIVVLTSVLVQFALQSTCWGAALNESASGATNIDVRWQALAQQQATGGRELGGSDGTETVDGMTVSRDPLFGTPNFIRLPGQVLKLAFGATVNSPEPVLRQAMQNLLDGNPNLFAVSGATLAESRVVRDATTPHNGVRSLTWLQQRNQLDVFNAQLRTAITQSGELVFISSGLLELGQIPDPIPNVSASSALVTAAQGIGMSISRAPGVISTSPDANRRQVFGNGDQFRFEPTARLVYFPLPSGEVHLAWWVVICPLDSGYYSNAIDAVTGEILLRQDMSVSESEESATYRAFAGNTNSDFHILDSPTPGSPKPLPSVPNSFQPPTRLPEVVTLLHFFDESLVPQPSPNGWLDDGATSFARGNSNNVDVLVDRDLDGISDVNPVAEDASFRNFAAIIGPPNLDGGPSGYRDFSMMQMFYTMNFLHDRFYVLGFDEAHGNFQRNNFLRGGVDGDPVEAVVQFGADLGASNNAFFSTPGDGQSGFLASLVWTGPSPDRDSALDAQVMVHEYTHGVTNRLVDSAFGFGLFALQSGGLGEGWSDFFSLCMLAEPGDELDGVYAVGSYLLLNSIPNFDDNYYFGIRRYPYSTDMTKNPLTFADIDPDQFAVPPDSQVPRSPRTSFDPSTATIVHRQGEIWSLMLWECRANLIDKFGFAGNEIMMQLVIDGLKLTPPNPSFIDARDAIYLADRISNDGLNLPELAKGFAKRGLGGLATSPPSNTTVGVFESHKFPEPEVAVRATVVEGRAPLEVLFKGAVVGVLADDAEIEWRFGDEQDPNEFTPGGLDPLHQVHIYSRPGSFTASFQASFPPATGGSGTPAEATVVVNVTEDINVSPTARIIAQIGDGDAPISVIFHSSGGDPDGRILLHEWSFGDGEFATGEVVLHNYEENGSFLVRLTVTDDRGGKDFTVRTIVIGDGDNALSSGGNALSQPNPTDTSSCGAVGLVSFGMMIVGLGVLRLGRSAGGSRRSRR